MGALYKDIVKGVAVVVISAAVLWGVRRVVRNTAPSLLE